jgi:hypothetical protein
MHWNVCNPEAVLIANVRLEQQRAMEVGRRYIFLFCKPLQFNELSYNFQVLQEYGIALVSIWP